MTDKERYRIAKAYLDKQLKTMEQNGLRITKISESEYETMVRQVAQAVSNVASGSKKAVAAKAGF